MDLPVEGVVGGERSASLDSNKTTSSSLLSNIELVAEAGVNSRASPRRLFRGVEGVADVVGEVEGLAESDDDLLMYDEDWRRTQARCRSQ